MDIFGFKKRRKKRSDNFIACLPHQTDDFLVTAWCDLDMHTMECTGNEYTRAEKVAVEAELDKRGFVDDRGNIIPKKLQRFDRLSNCTV